jgi:hypothetical protein
MNKISYIGALAAVFLLSSSVHAQDDSQMLSQDGNQQMLDQADGAGPENKYALRVLNPLNGSNEVGARMMLDDSTAIDVDFQFNFGADNEKGKEGTEDVTKGLALTAKVAYLKYMKKARVSPYYKGGVSFGVFTNDQPGNDDIGVFAALGAEFFAVPEFSLFAEIGSEVGLSPFALDTSGTRVGLAYYF